MAACHLSHISAAQFQDGRIFMWGHCRGHSIYTPTLTPYSHLDDVFACYSTPAVTWRTLQFRSRQDTPLTETLRVAFNDQVERASGKSTISLWLSLPMLDFAMTEYEWCMLQSRRQPHLGPQSNSENPLPVLSLHVLATLGREWSGVSDYFLSLSIS